MKDEQLQEIVDAYVECGKNLGYVVAETLLLKHLPKKKAGGYCCDVPKRGRAAFLADLKNAVNNGVKFEYGTLIILEKEPICPEN